MENDTTLKTPFDGYHGTTEVVETDTTFIKYEQFSSTGDLMSTLSPETKTFSVERKNGEIPSTTENTVITFAETSNGNEPNVVSVAEQMTTSTEHKMQSSTLTESSFSDTFEGTTELEIINKGSGSTTEELTTFTLLANGTESRFDIEAHTTLEPTLLSENVSSMEEHTVESSPIGESSYPVNIDDTNSLPATITKSKLESTENYVTMIMEHTGANASAVPFSDLDNALQSKNVQTSPLFHSTFHDDFFTNVTSEASLTTLPPRMTTNNSIFMTVPIYTTTMASIQNSAEHATTASTPVDDEVNDIILNECAFRTMHLKDFEDITEFPPTTPTEGAGKYATCLTDSTSHGSTTGRTSEVVTSQSEYSTVQESSSTSVEVATITTTMRVTKLFDAKNHGQTEALTSLGHGEHQTANITEMQPKDVNYPTTVFKPDEITEATQESVSGGEHLQLPTVFEEEGHIPKYSSLPNFPKESTCNLSDYLTQNYCVCSMDNLIADVRDKLARGIKWNFENYSCPILTHVDNGIPLENNSIPHIVKRFVDLPDLYRSKREIIPNYQVDRSLSEQMELKGRDNEIFATPGMKVKLPCLYNTDVVESTVNYSWTFSDLPLTEGKVQEKKGVLIIDNVSPQDGGNYTCTVISHDGAEMKYEHYVSVVALPTYTLTTKVVYNSTQKCQPGDTEIVSLYFPGTLGSYVCGSYFKVCKIDVNEPQCFEEYISLNLSVAIEPMDVIVPSLNTASCDVNCEMAIYSRIVMFIIKNLESVEKLPVFVRLSYRQEKLVPVQGIGNFTEGGFKAESPNLVIGCQPGFGYVKKTHICGACSRNTFSRGDETRCIECPAGQYQPMAGSKSCLVCATPLQDPYCLRVVYSNTHKFRVMIGSVAGVIVFIIVVLLWCQCSKGNDTERNGYKADSRRRRNRNADLERQEMEPLMSKERKIKRSNLEPPEPPRPDFF
ncbi:uncharacterized protein LOC116160654 [Photinus pyralis]|nr:uncharacterized protein LOC116160654 [Photinus pyralis]